jgi:hypothetical protein
MRIERSMESYRRNKGKLLCSTCLDKKEASLAKVEKQSLLQKCFTFLGFVPLRDRSL